MMKGGPQNSTFVIHHSRLRGRRARPSQGAEPPILRRSLLLAGALTLWSIVVIGRLYYLQIIRYADWVARAQNQQQRTVEIAPERGGIYDRHMRALAMSLPAESVYAVPSEFPNHEIFADLLARVLGVDAGQLLDRFQGHRGFCWVKRKVPDEVWARVQSLNLKGIHSKSEMKRFYPNGPLAAAVLGYVGTDDNGLAGLEYGMNEAIKGRPTRWLVGTDARQQRFGTTEWKGQPGKSVVLTLDQTIQHIAEKALDDSVGRWHAAGGAVIVQDPNTGEILAMASHPSFDPNRYQHSSAEERENKGIAWVYEPGSTFKLMTLAAALEEKLTRTDEVIDCQMGSIVLAGHVIHDHKKFGALTVEQILVHSSDVGAIKLGLRLGEERFYRYIRSFGFGSRTGIELPGEERGLLEPTERWSGISIGQIAMGQGIAVTPLQLVSAYSAIAKGGILFQPRLVREAYRDNVHDPIPPTAGRRVVSQHTAEVMKYMLMEVVQEGTGTPAQLRGYSAGGKTGTAQKVDPSGAYSHTHYVASFVGFAPVKHPAITVLVSIDSPVGAIYGAEVAAPAFKMIAEQSLAYLNIPQDKPSQLPQSVPPAPAVSSRPGEEETAAILPMGPRPPENWLPVQPVSFGEAARRPSGGTVVLDGGPLITVPDFSELAERRIADECQGLGLELNVIGSGLAVDQSPPPGSKVSLGTQVWVRLAR